MATTTTLMTAEELAKLPDDGCRYELIRGELLCMSPAGGRHAWLLMELGSYLTPWVREHGLGRVFGGDPGFILSRDPDVVLAPDIAFVKSERLPADEDQLAFMELAPDLVVEIISPSDRSRHVLAKAHEYLEAGVSLIWLIDPQDRMVTVYEPDKPPHTLTHDDALTGSNVLPGFTLPLSALFQEPGA